MSSTLPLERRAVLVRGIVQGVGFRPFVHSLAHRHRVTGAVWNDADGVRIEVEGAPELLDAFLQDLEEQAPPLARIEEMTWQPSAAHGDEGFRIEESRGSSQRQALVSPDV